MALFLQPYLLFAQTSVGLPPLTHSTATGGSDTLIFSGEFDHIDPSTNGTAGAFQWLHVTEHDFLILGGVSSELLGKTHWTLGTAGAAWHLQRWMIESSLRAGHGATASAGFKYIDLEGSVTYKASPHLYPILKAEYVDIDGSHGSIFRPGLCICNIHSYSTTVSAAHSAFGNLATEFISIHEEKLGRTVSPFLDVSVGKSLPRLLDPALNVYSSSSRQLTLSAGSRFAVTNRTSLTAAASYQRTGPYQTFSIAFSSNLKIRGD